MRRADKSKNVFATMPPTPRLSRSECAELPETSKLLVVKMRGCHGAGKTEFLSLIARLAEHFGMTTQFSDDGHNLSIISTSEQRCSLYACNRDDNWKKLETIMERHYE